MDNPIEGATYDFNSGMISPSSSVNTREKREPRQNNKSISLSKLDELNQVIIYSRSINCSLSYKRPFKYHSNKL